MTLQLNYVPTPDRIDRKNNQDSGYASPHLLVVADGMGGCRAGDLASAVAIETIRKIESPTTGEDMLDVLALAIDQANDKSLNWLIPTFPGGDGHDGQRRHVRRQQSRSRAHRDSRAYLFRDGHLERMTHDQTWVQSLVDAGRSANPKPRAPPPLAAVESPEWSANQRPRPHDCPGNAG